jgi:hypothetical protein
MNNMNIGSHLRPLAASLTPPAWELICCFSTCPSKLRRLGCQLVSPCPSGVSRFLVRTSDLRAPMPVWDRPGPEIGIGPCLATAPSPRPGSLVRASGERPGACAHAADAGPGRVVCPTDGPLGVRAFKLVRPGGEAAREEGRPAPFAAAMLQLP